MSSYFRNSYLDKVVREERIDNINREKVKSRKISKARKGKKFKKKGVGRPKGDKTIPNLVGQKASLRGGNVYVVSAKRGKYKTKPSNNYFNTYDSRMSKSGTFLPKAPIGGWTGWSKKGLSAYDKERDTALKTKEAIDFGKAIQKQADINKKQQETLEKLNTTILSIQTQNARNIARSGSVSTARSNRGGSISPRSLGRSESYGSTFSEAQGSFTEDAVRRVKGLTQQFRQGLEEGRFQEDAPAQLKSSLKELGQIFFDKPSTQEILVGGRKGAKDRLSKTLTQIKEQKKEVKRLLNKDERKTRLAELEAKEAEARLRKSQEEDTIRKARQSFQGDALTDEYFIPRGRLKFSEVGRLRRERISSLQQKSDIEGLSTRERNELKRLNIEDEQERRGLQAEKRQDIELARLSQIGGFDDPYTFGSEEEDERRALRQLELVEEGQGEGEGNLGQVSVFPTNPEPEGIVSRQLRYFEGKGEPQP